MADQRALAFKSFWPEVAHGTFAYILLTKASHTATSNFKEAKSSCATKGREPEILGGEYY